MEQPNLGKRISELRKSKGLTQEELAEHCKISARTLQRIENGVVNPRVYTVRAIFAALGCTLDGSLASEFHQNNTSVKRRCGYVYQCLKDLFNLKTNTMKKVSILSAGFVVLCFGLFVLCSESKAQASKNYVKDNSRGIVMLRPRGLTGYGQYYRNDTLFLHAGQDLIKEYNGNVYLNDLFAGHAEDGDTVIMHKATFFKKGKLEFKRMEYQKIPGYAGAVFIFPKHLPLRMAHNDQMYYWVGESEIVEKDGKIFLNGEYKGDAFTNDTVILKPQGTIIIKNTNRN
jgi:transcriptional regulator with XRE-family HTH domain